MIKRAMSMKFEEIDISRIDKNEKNDKNENVNEDNDKDNKLIPIIDLDINIK